MRMAGGGRLLWVFFKYDAAQFRLFILATAFLFMRLLISICFVCAVALASFGNGEGGSTKYYVQLVHGTDSNQPPQAGSKRIGAKVAATLAGPLKWKHYWEVCPKEVAVTPGRTTTVPLNNGREVQIDFTKQGKRAVTAIEGGKVVDRTIVPEGEALSVIGGDRDQKSAWFIVVRRDKPGT